jgi:hypothetical protein
VNIALDADMMSKLFQQAVLESLTPVKREEIIAQAIKKLFEPDNSSYGRKTSPLEDIFQQASQAVARQVVAAELEKPENKAAIQAMVVEAFQKMITDTARREKAVERMADALTAALVDKEYR